MPVKSLLRRWRAHREARVLSRRAIPDTLWRLTLARLPFLAARSVDDLAELRRLASLFLDQKEFTGAGSLEIDDQIAVCIAAQAVLPVLKFGLTPYAGFVGIDDGVVHAWDEVLSGEAMAGGPVMLSWRDVAESGESADWGYNVVIHEFAHVLDMGDGEADGIPPLPTSAERGAWAAVIDPAYERFCDQVDAGGETLLDPYGATSVDEFFAVASESFFVTPKEMRARHPEVYGLLARYFKQDPAAFTGD